MKRLRVYGLYEHGVELNPYCSGHIRMLRPLTHPSVDDRVSFTSGRRYAPHRHDVVLVERLWRPFINTAIVRQLIEEVRSAGAKLVYALDDNLFDLRLAQPVDAWFTDEHAAVLEMLASEADGILVSTERLRQRVSRFGKPTIVVPNALDERLICGRPGDRSFRATPGRIVIGYMGTRTHDEDLAMVAPALRRVYGRWGDRIEMQVVGAIADTKALRRLGGLPIRVVRPPADEADYPLFFAWFTQSIHWDIAIAPLCDNAFNVCKSDIKLLDYAAIGAAGVYSRLAPYVSVRDHELGLVAAADPDAWADALDRLIGDGAMRARIADAAGDHLFSRRTLARSAHQFVDAIESLAA